MAININKVSEEIQQQIIQQYQKGVSMRQLERDFDVTRQSISVFLTKIGVKTTVGNHHRIYYHNFDFFETIDNQKKAYWLGFMFADGFITSKVKHGTQKLGITIAERDRELLEKFKKDIEATNKIHTYPRKDTYPGSQPTVRIILTSQKTVDDLKKYGCVENKSLILEPPKNLPKKYNRHFIRGFFDGDGSISISKEKGYYTFSIVSTNLMLDWIHKELDFMGNIYKDKRREKSYYLNIGGRQQVLKIKNYLYDDAVVFLQRKYDVFSQI